MCDFHMNRTYNKGARLKIAKKVSLSYHVAVFFFQK
jgi:hypothetical protein